MSMNTCFKCGDIYDTDYQMEMIDDEMVCDKCWEKYLLICERCGSNEDVKTTLTSVNPAKREALCNICYHKQCKRDCLVSKAN